MQNSLKTLLLPFDLGEIVLPSGQGFFLQADDGASLVPDDWRARLVCEQSFKPDCLRLQGDGWRVADEIVGGPFESGLCLLTKHKTENLANLARAWRLLSPGGLLAFAGGNDIGVEAVARLFGKVAGPLATMAKHHAKVYWTRRSDENPSVLAAWEVAGQLQRVAATGYFSRPGLYNWDKIDVGSALLAEHFPATLGGRVADLGAGWGYLSVKIRERGPAIERIDLFEADGRALAAARANLGEPRPDLSFHWHDVRQGLPPNAFDWVVMNPPCHTGKAVDVGLGEAFIRAAAQGLCPRGHLLFVANRQLPYEAVVAECFQDFRIVVEKDGYKVIEATRGGASPRQGRARR